MTRIIPQLIVVAMLVWAILPVNPYGYYLVLRWICCAVFIYLAVQAIKLRRFPWAWIMGVAAGVYNPIVRVHATREFWIVLNLITVLIVVVSIFALKPVPEILKECDETSSID